MNRYFNVLLVCMLLMLTLFSTSSMITQDELGEVIKRKNQLIQNGMSADEVNNLMNGIDNWQEATDILDKKIDELSGETPKVTATPKPKATPKPQHEHKYSAKITKDPTCTEDGILTYICECGDTYEEPVKKLEHNYTETVTKEPTCTADGEKTYKCNLCGDSYTEVINAKGHTDGQFLVTKQPTCTEQGEKTLYCSVCSEPIKTEIIEATGHENTYTKTTNPGFFSTGKEEVICMKCYEVLETKVVPVPMWQYYTAYGVGALVLFIAIIVIAKKCKKK